MGRVVHRTSNNTAKAQGKKKEYRAVPTQATRNCQLSHFKSVTEERTCKDFFSLMTKRRGTSTFTKTPEERQTASVRGAPEGFRDRQELGLGVVRTHPVATPGGHCPSTLLQPPKHHLSEVVLLGSLSPFSIRASPQRVGLAAV